MSLTEKLAHQAAAAIAGLAAACGGQQQALKPGAPAPAFDLPGTDGHQHKLADHVGKRAVVIAWYPAAHTFG
ncbi:MAG: redoxin domain-containing protein [Myxococcales bacterium]|nr:redoxin domain-containing protein [Myxococcales bacterium]